MDLYCGQFYCQRCAEMHFGKTREQYNAEKVSAASKAETRGPWTGGYHWHERHNAIDHRPVEAEGRNGSGRATGSTPGGN